MVWHTAVKFIADKSGGYAVSTALAILPLMAGLGVSYDFVQGSSLRGELSRSMDQAALAGAQDWVRGSPVHVVERTVRAFALANLDPKFGDDLHVTVKFAKASGRKGHEMSVSAKLKVRPAMAPVYAAFTGKSADAYDYVISVP